MYGVHEIKGATIKKETLINRVVEKALKNDDLAVYEPGTQSKNFLHVADVAAVYRRAVEKIANEKEKETKFFCLNGSESAILELGQLREDLARKRHRGGLDGAKRKKNLDNRRLRLHRLPIS